MNFASVIRDSFPFEPTPGQQALIDKLSAFVLHPDNERLFVLKGYAGTGKTTIVSALVKSLPAVRWRYVLLAPTGRAAKVLATYSGEPAFTIHKKIYRPRASGSGGGGYFQLQANVHKHTIFIVDEASMIGESAGDTQMFPHSLLEDLYEYVYTGEHCKLLLIGDSAQLPPVGMSESPALNIAYMKSTFGCEVEHYELKEVMRQVLDSGVLLNATRLRINIAEGNNEQPKFELSSYSDLVRLPGSELVDTLEQSYRKYGAEDTIIICRSNKRANIYNQQIRSRILWREDEISAGDQLMIVKNNYFWLPKESKAGFIANGDTAGIIRISKYREMHGLRFADVTLQLLDYPDEPELDVRILLDTLHSEAPALTRDQAQAFFESVHEDYAHIGNKRERYQEMRKDPYFNALQVKFAYAVTCHKAQGGQWKSVFVEQGYLTPEMLNTEYLRWLYTALTRTREKLYLVGFNDAFFD